MRSDGVALGGMSISRTSPFEAIVRLFRSDPIRTLFYEALSFQYYRKGGGYPFGSYFEFGVGEGKSLRSYLRAAQSFAVGARVPPDLFHTVCFDSFEGLPNSADPRDRHPEWRSGKFATSRERIERIVSASWLHRRGSQVRLVPGRFDESLTPALRTQVESWRPAIVNIDCDYYTSARLALSWLRPILPPGTIVHFDDFWEQQGDPNRGEVAAVQDFNAEGRGQLIPFPNIGQSRAGAVFMFTERRTG